MDENRVDITEEEEDWRPPIIFPDDDEEEIPAQEPENEEQAAESVEEQPAEKEENEKPVDTRVRKGVKKKTSIGGQALIEGVMMRGPHRTAMAVRTPEGTITVEDVNNVKEHKIIKKIPIVRGVFSFAESLKVGMSTMTRSAELAGFDDEPEEKKKDDGKEKKESGVVFGFLMTVASILGVGLAIVLFVYLPSLAYKGVSWLCQNFLPGTPFTDFVFAKEGASPTVWQSVIHSAFEGIIKIVIFILYIALISKMKDIYRVFQYHGAEHKSIFCYENGEELTVENVKKYKRFHPRCGTSFLIIMLILSIVVGMFIQTDVVWLRACIRLACIPIIMGVGYELLKLCGRHDNFLTRIIAAPGLWMQRLTTKEPEDDMIECAIEALITVIPENQEDDRW